ncbi:hypothetical protein K435DRAFT_469698 [Dendrothele bispora CBS 962.96]|uniref:Uncharacterized protein n=1 Tax=Dendrothele bispora (strain CBS 962.96) TaxID=1314807 RepID=A0A4S8L076_DENBC|nr:hypothetical protein K435DRAFT_469698 [Dendrothele bispora CBS 962.96]
MSFSHVLSSYTERGFLCDIFLLLLLLLLFMVYSFPTQLPKKNVLLPPSLIVPCPSPSLKKHVNSGYCDEWCWGSYVLNIKCSVSASIILIHNLPSLASCTCYATLL